MREPTYRFLASLAAALLAGGAVRAADVHRLDRTEVRVGEVFEYRVAGSGFESVAALAATTVHPPAGPDLELVSRGMTYGTSAAGCWREDVFRLRTGKAGDLLLEPALVDRPGRAPEPVEALGLRVLPAAGTGSGLPPLGWIGLGLLVPAAAIFQLRRSRAPAGADKPAGPAPAFTAAELLRPVKEARLRGDPRAFHVALMGALRTATRLATGRSPRDARELAAQARLVGLPESMVDQVRAMAVRCEQVAFGGDQPGAAGLTESYAAAERVIGAFEEAVRRGRGEEPGE